MAEEKMAEEKIKKTYRFTLESESYPRLHLFVKEVKIDFIKSKIKIAIYNLASNETRNMINGLILFQEKEKLTFKNYDEKGKELEIIEFSKLKFTSSSIHYTYEMNKDNASFYVLKGKFNQANILNVAGEILGTIAAE